jgi:hypothetical protein
MSDCCLMQNVTVYLLLVYNPLPKYMCRIYFWGRRGRDSYVVGFKTT